MIEQDRFDEHLQRVGQGADPMGQATGAPVVPVGIWGTQDRWPKAGLHYRRPWRRTIAVVCGEPIDPRGDKESLEDVQVFTDLVMTGVAKQVAEARALARSAPAAS